MAQGRPMVRQPASKMPNLQKKRFYLAEEDKWITLKLSTEAIRTINKKGLYTVVKELRSRGEHI